VSTHERVANPAFQIANRIRRFKRFGILYFVNVPKVAENYLQRTLKTPAKTGVHKRHEIGTNCINGTAPFRQGAPSFPVERKHYVGFCE